MKQIKYKNSPLQDILSEALVIFISLLLFFLASQLKINSETVRLLGFSVPAEMIRIFIYAVSIAFSFYRTAIESIDKLLIKKFSPELLITLGVLAIFASKNFSEAALIAVIYSAGRFVSEIIENALSVKYLEYSGDKLTYNVIKDGVSTVVSASELQKGDMVSVSEDMYIAFYGSIGGENAEKKVKPGICKFEGETVIKFKELARYSVDFTSMNDSKTKFEKYARLISYLYMLVVIVAGVAFYSLGYLRTSDTFGIIRSLGNILLLACPLPIVNGIVHAAAIFKASFLPCGIKFDSAESINILASCKKLIFNKAGALTKGDYSVKTVEAANGYTDDSVLKIAAAAEKNCDNKIAEAIKSAAVPAKSEISEYDFYPEKGISCLYDGKRVLCGSKRLMSEKAVDVSALSDASVYVAVDGVCVGAIILNDILRSDSVKAFKVLGVLNKKTAIVSGDSVAVTEKVAGYCGCTEFYSLADGEQKRVIVADSAKRMKTAFIGDGNTDIDTADITMCVTDNEFVEHSTVKPNRLSEFAMLFNSFKNLNLYMIFRLAGVVLLLGVLTAAVYSNTLDGIFSAAGDEVATEAAGAVSMISCSTLIATAHFLLNNIVLLLSTVITAGRKG